MADSVRTKLVPDALKITLWTRRPACGAVSHSESVHGGCAFCQRCDAAGVHASMGSRGIDYDNATTHGIFVALKCELLARHTFRSHAAARMAPFNHKDLQG